MNIIVLLVVETVSDEIAVYVELFSYLGSQYL